MTFAFLVFALQKWGEYDRTSRLGKGVGDDVG